MSDEVVVQNKTTPEVADLLEEDVPLSLVHLVATDAMQMASAQSRLTLWLKAKQIEVESDIAEMTSARDNAKAHKWNTTSFGNQINKAKKRKVFYDKLLIAAEAGYTIIPNFPIDLMAVRVVRDYPSDDQTYTHNDSAPPSSYLAEKADIAKPGEGDYVAPIPSVSRWTSRTAEGSQQFNMRAISLRDMEFPVSIAIPQIMEATARAMALKVFDQIGICPAKDLRTGNRTTQLPPSRDPDPIIVGQILNPRQGYTGARPVSFLIAWHLDLRTL